MSGETKGEEHRRLQERTEELKHEHEGLSLDRAPFNQADHDEHTSELRKHAEDLKKHRERLHRDEH
jgi:hypothetical protein